MMDEATKGKRRFYLKFDLSNEYDLKRYQFLSDLSDKKEMHGFCAFAIDLGIAIRKGNFIQIPTDDNLKLGIKDKALEGEDVQANDVQAKDVQAEKQRQENIKKRAKNSFSKLRGFHKK